MGEDLRIPGDCDGVASGSTRVVRHRPGQPPTMPSVVVKISTDKKEAAPPDPFKELKTALDDQEKEITMRAERLEERILQAEARTAKDSNPVTSVFGELARNAAWSS